ncbi:MAG: hypothetical protein UZ22_OP11002000435 [Microgenomates bacterium OLB23]|nr:MAG: hypothetical protein UZ22_OP11002000435 [Microgenomates bacterium OLB23]
MDLWLTQKYLSPAETGGLIDEKVDRRDIVAALVDLARRGFLTIEERDRKDFYLISTRTRAQSKDTPAGFEQRLLDALFGGGDEVRVKDVKNITSELLEIENMIYTGLESHKLFVKNPKKSA